MGTPALQLNLKGLQFLYPTAGAEPRRIAKDAIPGIPTWITRAVDLYELTFLDKPNAPLFLVLPKTEIDFEHLRRLYDQLDKRLNAHIVIVADPLPPKHRPLLARCRIPFIYKDETFFAPDLGFRTANLKKLRQEPKLKSKKNGLAPFALKIIAGVLTNQLPKKFTRKLLDEQIQEKGFKISLGKLTPALHELAAANLLIAQPDGKAKPYAQKSMSEYVTQLDQLKFAPLFREVESYYIPSDRKTYVIAGETALAHYTNLADPTQKTIAMSAKDFHAVFDREKATTAHSDFGNPTIIQVWKEDPQIFAVDGVLNPVELFFSMKDHTDERVQISLDELLAPYGIKRT